jgi:hypothetical protein
MTTKYRKCLRPTHKNSKAVELYNLRTNCRKINITMKVLDKYLSICRNQVYRLSNTTNSKLQPPSICRNQVYRLSNTTNSKLQPPYICRNQVYRLSNTTNSKLQPPSICRNQVYRLSNTTNSKLQPA